MSQAPQKIKKLFIPILILLLVFVIGGITAIVLTDDEPQKKFFDVVLNLMLWALPILVLALCIDPISDYVKTKDKNFSENEKEFLTSETQKALDKVGTLLEMIAEISARLDSLIIESRGLKQIQEISHFYFSYNDVDWELLLKDALKVDYSLLYAGDEWLRRNRVHITEFVARGGVFNLYMPSPISISNFFLKDAVIIDKYSKKIGESLSIFNEIAGSYPDQINLKILTEGFNYAYAYITLSDQSKSYLMSVYQNNYNKTDSPVIVFNTRNANSKLKEFIEQEKSFIDRAETHPNYWNEKYIVWSSDGTKVFVSTALECPANCSFCYVGSIITNKGAHKLDPLEKAKVICNLVCNDSRFKEGKNGTVIMLGGFTDPFFDSNHAASMYIANFFSKVGNFIHIATRYAYKNTHPSNLPKKANIVINFSIALLNETNGLSKKIEIPNQIKRFESAKWLIEQGYNVGLFIRPIIKGVTVKYIDEIISLAKEAKIENVTIGGLYVDDRILKELKYKGVDLSGISNIDKQFVLDDQKILKKLDIEDIDDIFDRLNSAGFNVFRNSSDRIEFYKRASSK